MELFLCTVTKQELRKHYSQLRSQISSKEKLRLDDLLLLQFQQIDFSFVETVLTYWGISKNNEPNTHLFSSYLRFIVPPLKICYPVADFLTHEMQAVLINEDTVYTTNEYGITEPKEGKLMHPTAIDLVLVPMFVCDTEGFRIGYGKGFYDRFLATCKNEVVTIGFSYFEPVEMIDDINEFDMPLSCCITPNNIYEF